MSTQTARYAPAWGFARHNIPFLLAGKALLPGAHLPRYGHAVPKDLFGICVATNRDPASDDYLIDRLRSLGIGHVRVDYNGSPDTARLLERLHREQIAVCLHLVQVPAPSLDRWRAFVQEAVDRFGSKAEQVEIGATCNRRRWCGTNMAGFLDAWTVAHGIVTRAGVPLAGPNVTDFEPLYNIMLLGTMREAGTLPAIHTTNLFVERVTEPERFDHRILGRAAGNRLKFNLVKKAALIAAVSRHNGVTRTQCSHVAWSLRRINRVLPNTEEKQADYVTRYGCLAAASGALDRVYWGPMVGQREGLIDDGTTHYPEIPHVTYYGEMAGEHAAYRERPAFLAYQTLNTLLPGTRYDRALATAKGLEIHAFNTSAGVLHVAWTTNGNVAPLANCYTPECLQAASATSRDGLGLDEVPCALTETPLYLSWKHPDAVKLCPDPATLPGVRVSARPHVTYARVESPPWTGVVATPKGQPAHARDLCPQKLEDAKDRKLLRDRRNCVWSMPHPGNPSKTIVVKRLQVRRWYRKILQRFRSSKAMRSWNGSHELLRRGIRTCQPLACFENATHPGIADSYFAYEMFADDASVRQALTAFTGGSKEYLGRSREGFLGELAIFLNDMHTRGVFFRDLSAGNILFRITETGGTEFCLIDTGRARFSEQARPMGKRLSDLKRIAHPLDRTGRNALLAAYLKEMGRRPAPWMKLPFLLYNMKHAVKGALPRKRLQPKKTNGRRGE